MIEGQNETFSSGAVIVNGAFRSEPPIGEFAVSFATYVALEALGKEIERLGRQRQMVLAEAGLDPQKVWNISPDGVATEVEP